MLGARPIELSKPVFIALKKLTGLSSGPDVLAWYVRTILGDPENLEQLVKAAIQAVENYDPAKIFYNILLNSNKKNEDRATALDAKGRAKTAVIKALIQPFYQVK